MNRWLRVIRIKFLLASVIAVSNGLALSYLRFNSIEISYAILTYLGIMALHASVDLLNDYWDYKRGIDKLTKRTQFSGGTGVLPEGLLDPNAVYRAGIIMLIIGSIIGIYFVILKGILILIILTFAVISIYFYSNKVVNIGLGELFVAIKGSMIVLGTFYVQTSNIELDVIYNSIIIGQLSSLVLFINSFPDHDADKSKGRRTLVIILGKEKGSRVFILLVLLLYAMITIGIISKLTPIYALSTLLLVPYLIKIVKRLIIIKDADIYIMSGIVKFSRFIGVLLLLSFILSSFI
jgi:1,4-dihydroxy-2-naphthoate octaprenyltransferase